MRQRAHESLTASPSHRPTAATAHDPRGVSAQAIQRSPRARAMGDSAALIHDSPAAAVQARLIGRSIGKKSGRAAPDAATAQAPLQRLRVTLPALPGWTETVLGQQVPASYENDAEMEIDTDDLRHVHMPDVSDHEKDFFVQKFLAAANTTYLYDMVARDAMARARERIRANPYGEVQEAQAQQIDADFAFLSKEPSGTATPSYQTIVRARFQQAADQVRRREPKYSRELQQLAAALAALKLQAAQTRSTAKEAMHGELRTMGAVDHDAPAANRVVASSSVSHGSYTVGQSVTAWVAIHGAAQGEDVMGARASSDLNYKYGLTHVNVGKLVAGHLLPALLGGRATDDNLTPIANEANGLLKDGPEKAAQHLLYKDDRCVQYEISCGFGAWNVGSPLEADINALIASSIQVKVTPLAWDRDGGDSTDWAQYAPDGGPQTFKVPAERLYPNWKAMAIGVQRPDLNRSKLGDGLR